MHSFLRSIAAAGGLIFVATAANAACDPEKPGAELSMEEANELYQCIEEMLYKGYNSGDSRWIPKEYVSDYRDWVKVSSAPAAPGFHSGRFLVTWVNEAGAEEYMKYLDERGPMPEGTLIAKESFGVDDAGKLSPGPLFLMEKVEEGKSPRTNDWYYMMMGPGGQPVAVDVYTACAACHNDNFGQRDGMGYPVEEARVRP